MLKIPTKVWSHQSIEDGERRFNSDVRASDPMEVTSFRQLVETIAKIAYHNPEHVLFYRGQEHDYQKTTKDKGLVSSFYPSIYRQRGGRLTTQELEDRFRTLDNLSVALLRAFADQQIVGHEKLSKFPELSWAILQHYEVCHTPLLDVTHSLRVAASFALNGQANEGYLYVFGFPHPNGSISYSADLELINIRLLSICPPEAHRPYFQEGFLVGTFPSRRLLKHPSLDLGVRLIGKFKLRGAAFWDDSFHAIPDNALYPLEDRVRDICEALEGRG